jgi:hypothetical protein
MKTLLSFFLLAASSAFATVPVSITFNLPSALYLTDVEASRFLQRNVSPLEGTLAASITSGVTSITITGICPANGVAVYIDAEPILVTAGSGTSTCAITRNSALSQANTTAAAHTSGATIFELKYPTAQTYFIQIGVASFVNQCIQNLGSASAVIGTSQAAITASQAAINAAFTGSAQ